MGPIVFVLSMTIMAFITRWADTPSPLIDLLAPYISFVLAWSTWAVTLKPAYGFGWHSALGLVVAALVLAIRIVVGPAL